MSELLPRQSSIRDKDAIHVPCDPRGSDAGFKVLYSNTILVCYDYCQVFDLRHCYVEMQMQLNCR